MRRALSIVCMLTFMGVAGCVPAPITQPVLPTFVQAGATDSMAVPEPNDAYPTAQASESSASQSVSGFSLSLRRAWRDGKQVNAEVCFSLPDASDWTVWEAHLEYGGTSISEFSSSYLSKEEGQSGQPG